MLRGEAVGLEQTLRGRRRAEVIDAHDLTLEADIVPPAGRRAGLHRHPPGHRRRQHALLVRIVLGIEGVGAGHEPKAPLPPLPGTERTASAAMPTSEPVAMT